MAEISSYPKIQPKAQDLLLGSRTYVEGVDEFTGNPTSVFTVKGIVDLVSVEAGGVSGTVGKIPVFTNATTVGDSIITQNTNGYVGIGINMPSQKLHVDGSARVTGGYYDSSNSQGTSGQVLSSTGSGTTWVTPTSGGTGTVTSVSGTGTVSGLTLTGTVTSSGDLTLGGTLALTSANVTTGLGFTPYNATNPAGYTDLTLGTTSSTALAGNTTTISSPQAQAIATSVRFDTDNFVSTPPVNKIITLTQAEYTAITTPNVNTLYIII